MGPYRLFCFACHRHHRSDQRCDYAALYETSCKRGHEVAVLESQLAKMREELSGTYNSLSVELDLLEDAGMALSAQLEDIEDNIIAVCWGHLSESIQKIGDVIRSFIPTDSPLPEAKNADGKLPPL